MEQSVAQSEAVVAEHSSTQRKLNGSVVVVLRRLNEERPASAASKIIPDAHKGGATGEFRLDSAPILAAASEHPLPTEECAVSI
jgi:hypothetical protein